MQKLLMSSLYGGFDKRPYPYGNTMPESSPIARLRGNTFITIPKGTIVWTDDPNAPKVMLLEDVKVCSDARAEYINRPNDPPFP